MYLVSAPRHTCPRVKKVKFRAKNVSLASMSILIIVQVLKYCSNLMCEGVIIFLIQKLS